MGVSIVIARQSLRIQCSPSRLVVARLDREAAAYWVARSSRAMTAGMWPKTRIRPLAAWFARALLERSVPRERGSRECRVHAAPAVSCAKCTKESAHEHTGSAETLRHSLRNGFTAYAVISPETNSSCLRRCRLDGYPIRLDRDRHRQLGTSNGCRDHTVLPYASAPFVCAPVDRSRETRPAITSPLARRRCRVHRIPPYVRDDRDTPLAGKGRAK